MMSHSRQGSASPSFSGRSPSPYFSGEHGVWDSSYDVEMSASRPVSPLSEGQGGNGDYEVDSVTCLWENCGRPFSHLQTLIDHIHNEHIGMNKSTYTCEWATCSRRGIQQASRFALISHIRAHTGEKPFTCPLPECDKSFTRSDAMAKHMRLQHNISPPLPGRGGSRKRKRDDSNEAEGIPNPPTFKVEGHTPTDLTAGTVWGEHEDNVPATSPIDELPEYFNPLAIPRNASPGGASTASAGGNEREDPLPEHLLQHLDPHTGKIMGRSLTMVRYLLMKAKHRFVLEQHESLLEELRVMRNEERRAHDQKEETLNELLRSYLGPQAEFVIRPAQMISLYAPPPTQQGVSTVDDYMGGTNGS